MRTPTRIVTFLAALLLGLGTLVATAGTASAVTQAEAESAFRSAGITWTSSGGCTSPSNPTCTSFSGLRQASVDGARTLKSASGCALTITGGTETGHAGGTYSHANGYKLDFQPVDLSDQLGDRHLHLHRRAQRRRPPLPLRLRQRVR